jgi:hypothetical protein
LASIAPWTTSLSRATRRFVLGAVLVSPLVRLHRLARGADLRVGLKPYLRAA